MQTYSQLEIRLMSLYSEINVLSISDHWLTKIEAEHFKYKEWKMASKIMYF